MTRTKTMMTRIMTRTRTKTRTKTMMTRTMTRTRTKTRTKTMMTKSMVRMARKARVFLNLNTIKMRATLQKINRNIRIGYMTTNSVQERHMKPNRGSLKGRRRTTTTSKMNTKIARRKTTKVITRIYLPLNTKKMRATLQKINRNIRIGYMTTNSVQERHMKPNRRNFIRRRQKATTKKMITLVKGGTNFQNLKRRVLQSNTGF